MKIATTKHLYISKNFYDDFSSIFGGKIHFPFAFI